MLTTSGQKRTLKLAKKSCKRLKSDSINYDVQNGQESLKYGKICSNQELDDSSSVSSPDSCEPESFNSGLSTAIKSEDKNNHNVKSEMTKCLAIDCEMVGVGEYRSSALARCSLINYNGDIVFDAFVKPDEPVTDYRTKWSGVRESDLKNAIAFKKARKEVKKLIKNKILIGHSMRCDLNVLNLYHPLHLVRDTSQYHTIRLLAGLSVNNTPSLRDLSSILLNEVIQDKEHCSVEDARATMSIYKLCEQQWEQELQGQLSTESYLSDLYWPSWTRTDSTV